MTPNSSNPRKGAATVKSRRRSPGDYRPWPPDLGVITPACEDRSEIFSVPLRTAIGLRLGVKLIFVLSAARKVRLSSVA